MSSLMKEKLKVGADMIHNFDDVEDFQNLLQEKEEKYHNVYSNMIKYIKSLKDNSKSEAHVEEVYYLSQKQLLSQENLIQKQ